MAAPEVTEAADTAGEAVARASDRARENTPKLWRISLNSLLPCLGAHQNQRPGGFGGHHPGVVCPSAPHEEISSVSRRRRGHRI